MIVLWLGAAFAGRYAMDDNHPDLRWETLSTEHFSIHYPVSRRRVEHRRSLSGEQTALRVAAIADDVWLRLCGALEFFPNERIDVVILEQEDRLQGFTLPEQDWIVFSGNPGPELHRMRGHMEWTSDLLAHELAHVLTLKQTSWLGGSSSSFGAELGSVVEGERGELGFSVDLAQEIPYWFSEGAAEYWSEVAGYNWWTSSRERTLRTSVLDGRLLCDNEWRSDAVLDDWYDPERAYQQGYAFHRWFADAFGMAAWREVMRASGRRLRLDWSRVFVEVTGQTLEQLKIRFEADLVARVNRDVAEVKAKGVVEGSELALWSLGWQDPSPRVQDRWALKDAARQEERRESTGTTLLHAAYSEDGAWFARNRSGWLEFHALDEGMWTPFAGAVPDWGLTAGQRDRDRNLGMWVSARFGSDFDFVPGEQTVVYVDWERADRVSIAPVHYEWTQLYTLDLTPDRIPLHHKGGRLEVDGFKPGEARERRRKSAIPGTLRAVDPSVSPDGEWLAFLRYADGSTNLVVSRLDGSQSRQLTSFTDGTWLQGTDWSPDGSEIVFSMHRDFQQNLWVAEVATAEIRPLMRDRWEEVDPLWAEDGAIWFSADVDGIFDIFRRAPDGTIRRITRVLTGAQSPSLTPSGNLLYTHFTGFGWKSYGLERTRFSWDEATERFGPADSEESGASPAPELPSRRYRPLKHVTGLAASPLIRVDRDREGRLVPRVGAYLKVRDAVEVNSLVLQGWLGADAYASARWTWHRLWPDVEFTGSHWVGRIPGEEGKRAVSRGGVGLTLPWREDLDFTASLFGYQVLREGPDGRLAPYVTSRTVTVGMGVGESGLSWDNDRRGSAQRILFTRGDTCAGSACSPYHRAEWFAQMVDGGSNGHRWIADLAVGLTDSTVHAEDDLRAGGDHPYALRIGRIQGNVAFPGYTPYALSGTHLGVLGLGYRVPLARQMHLPIGPLLLDAIYVQLGGHLGTLTDGVILPVYADGVGEVRLVGSAFDSRWDSSLRFAWGRKTPSAQGGPRLMLSLGAGF